MKKIIALIISVIMIFSVMPLSAFAAEILPVIEIGDISEPVPGQSPDYVATYGKGYNFTTTFDNLNMHYGVAWIDITNGASKSMNSDDVFQAGHKYRVAVVVKAQSGYLFSKTDNFTTSVTGRINGKQGSAYAITGYNAGEYVGITYEFAVCDYARISSCGVTGLDIPAAGEKIDFTAVPKDDSYTVSSVYWRDSTSNSSVSEGAVAVAGHKYEVEIWLRAKDDYRFRIDGEGYPSVSAKIGAYNANVIETESEGVVVGITDSYIVPDDITAVSVSGIDAPVMGATPDTAASCGSGYVIKEINWVDKTGEYKDWIRDITVFEPGRKYCVEVTLETISNYRFSTDYDGVTDVDAKINGEKAIVYSDYSTTTVVIGFEFPATEAAPPTVIDTVYVNGIDAPVADGTVDTDAVCVEEGYTITEIIWVDTTDKYENWVYGVEKFEAGRKYTVQISLVTEEGYEFLVVDGYNETNAVINGQTAIAYGSHSETELAIGFEFPAVAAPAPTVLETVYVNGIDAPVAGGTVDTDAVCVEEGYTITEIIWVDTTDKYENWVYGVEKFEAGRKYTVQISLVTEEGYEFLVVDGYNETNAVINGQTSIAYGSHSETELAIGFEFEQLPEMHAHIYNSVVTEPTCTEKGFTTYTCECGDTYTGDEVKATDHNFGDWTVVKNAEVGVEGKEERKCGNCDVTEERIIPALDKPADDYILGDVNGDTKVNAIDARIVLRISAQLDSVGNYTQPVAAFDVTKDGKVNAIDARKILRVAAQIDTF